MGQKNDLRLQGFKVTTKSRICAHFAFCC